MKITLYVLAALCFGQALCYKDYVLRDLGCWQDKSIRAIPKIDHKLQGPFDSRSDAIQKCAVAAKILGYNVIGVQHGGQCFSGPDALKTYKKYGTSSNCRSDGKGGTWSNQVYEVDTVMKVKYSPVGCFKDQKQRAILPTEGRFVDLHDTYKSRVDAIRKCARAAVAQGDIIFAVQNGGWCASSNVTSTYDKYGPSQDCNADGKGGPSANDVYEITGTTLIRLKRLGCFLDKSDRAMPPLERPEVFDVDDYKLRPHAIEACVRYASGLQYQYVGIQDGGQCLAGTNFNKYGSSRECLDDSKGGPWANEVFHLSWEETPEAEKAPLPQLSHYYLNNLGCWKDTSNRAMSTLEGKPILIGPYQERKDAIQRCAQAAMCSGFRIMAVQHGGQCFASAKASATYRKYGISDKCDVNGKGGPWANQVYEINTIYNPVFSGLGCYKDTPGRAIRIIEGTLPSISGEPQKRTDAVNKCARAAAFYGYKVFGVQHGGECFSSTNAMTTYMKYGLAANCGNGRGGAWANSVSEILDAGVFHVADRGCWADDSFRTIPPVEAENPEFIAHSNYKTREDAVAKCARFARSRKFSFFALQDGGWCVTSANAGDTYMRIGRSINCASDGKGGPWANQVYEIV